MSLLYRKKAAILYPQIEPNTVKALTHKELAEKYGVTSTTMTNWVRKIKVKTDSKRNKIYTPAQLAIIFEKLGRPDDDE